MACSEFLLRYRYLQYLTAVRPREERCPDCQRMTQVLPIHYPGKFAFYDVGHLPGCKQYMQNAEAAHKFRFERLPLPHSWNPLVVPVKSLWREWTEIMEQPDRERRLKEWMEENFKNGKPTKRAMERNEAAKKEEEREKPTDCARTGSASDAADTTTRSRVSLEETVGCRRSGLQRGRRHRG